MYNLSLHIEFLLLRHDCVVVPGVGAFINVRHSARRDDATGAWLPMTREVRFNSALNHDDGLLANSFARKNEVSFEEGRELLRRETHQLLSTLREEGEVTLGQLGILRQEEGTIIFAPLRDASKLAAMLGFSEAPIHRTAPASFNNGTEDSMQDAPATTSDSQDDEALIYEYKEPGRVFDTKRNYYIGINKIFARAAACLILVSAIALSVILPVSERRRVDQASVVPVEKIIRQTASIVTTESETAEVPENQTPVNNAEGKRFHAVVATFATSVEAEKFIAQHSDSGYEFSVITTPTRSRVSVLDSNDRESMRSEMSSPEFRSHFAQAWIWEHTVE